MLAENKIALHAGWDMELLSSELADMELLSSELADMELLSSELEDMAKLDLDFALEITGFEVLEIDLIIKNAKANHVPGVVVAIAGRGSPRVCYPVELWRLGACVR